MTKAEILARCKEEDIRFLRLQFIDLEGTNKNVEVPSSQFEAALDGKVLFDGSSIEGFARIEESDMLLLPDPRTFIVFPWGEPSGRVAWIACDIMNPDGTPFAGCSRSALSRQVDRARSLGFELMCGPEAEFFLFQRSPDGDLTRKTHDRAGYFDMTPVDREDARRAIVAALEAMGFEIEAAHHEVAHGQHEINFRYAHALETADRLALFKFVVRKVALEFNLHATFMPKPIYGENGSGMHTNLSLFRGEENAFYDPNGPNELSDVGRGFIAGLLKHVRGFSAITNPLVNSYKRLVPGFEAPTHIAWSERNRSPLCRVPATRGAATRVELRSPDPSCNPYLAFAVMLAAGLDGIEKGLEPGPPVNKNIYAMSERERKRLRVKTLPIDLSDAIDALERAPLVREVLGPHIYQHFVRAKKTEWAEYIAQVTGWEIDRYLGAF